MSALYSFGTLYLQINFLLVTAFVFFALSLGLTRLARIHANHIHLLRISQLLILLSLALPLFFHLIPTDSLPEISLLQFQPGSEGTPFNLDQKKDSRAHNTFNSTSAAIETKPSLEKRLAQWVALNKTSVVSVSVIFWVLGFLFCVARFIRNTKRLKTILTESILVRKVGKVYVAISCRVAVPFSLLWGKQAWVILPENLLGSQRNLELALKHELQHHRQRDTVWAIAIEALLCFFYANPALHLWKRKITEFQEFSCDKALLGQRGVSAHDYGSCLVRVAETALATREMYVGTTYMAAGSRNPVYFKSFLRRRIEMIVEKRSPAKKWLAISIGTVCLLFTVAAAYSAEQKSRAPTSVNPGTFTVNKAVQKIADTALLSAVTAQKAAAGFAIVSDPNTGKVLAVANIDTKKKKTGYWSLSQRMEPASLSKALIAAVAIERNLTTPQESHSCENGNYQLGDRVYHDWKKEGWPALTTEEAVANSSDICSMKIAQRIGNENLMEMLKNFGFGPNGTAQQFPKARVGLLPEKDATNLAPAITYGAGYRSTPIELLQAFNAIANGGNLMAPKSADTPDSEKEVIRRVLSAESAQQARTILQAVVTKGTARGRGESKLYTTAGKTGSSQSLGMDQLDWMGGNKKTDVAQFIGFAPVNNPRVSVYVAIFDPHTDDTGAHGSHHAAPVFKEIAEAVLKEMKVAPDKPQG